MANRKVTFDIEANDKSSKAINSSKASLDKLKNNFSQLTGVSLGTAGAIGAAGFAVQKLAQFINSAISGTEQYVSSITDMSRVLGISTEDTSKLVQASDDLFISQEKLNAALLAASRQGIDVSIEGLKKLSGQYLSLNPGVERAEFLMKKFGRSGSDIGKLMEVGADGIDQATAAIAKNLIVTEQSKINIENYKRSVDNLSDSWQGLKYTVGNAVIPQLDLLTRQLTPGIDAVEEYELKVNELNEQMMNLAKYGGMGGLSIEEVAAQMAELQGQVDSLTGSMKKQDEIASVLAGDVNETSKYFKQLTAELIFNQLAATMDSKAQMELARQMNLIDEATYTTLSALDELNAKYDSNGNSVLELTEKTKKYDAELAAIIAHQNSLSDKTVTYTIITNQITNGGAKTGGSAVGIPTAGQMETKASGGSGIVPPGFNHDNFLVGLSSGERFDVKPSSRVGASDKGGGGGNSYTFIVNGNNSPEEFLRKCATLVKQQGGLPQK